MKKKPFREAVKQTAVNVLEVLNPSSYSAERNINNKYTLFGVSMFTSLICVCMSFINAAMEQELMERTTIVLAIMLAVAGVLSLVTELNWLVSLLIIGPICIFFTGYVIVGGNDGFAATWILLAPLLITCVFGFREGAFVSLYFAAVVVVLFWSPGQALLRFDYTENYMLRFPMAYFCGTVTTLIYGYRLARSQLKEARYTASLEDSVRQERERVASISLAVIDSMNKTLEAKNPYTREHAERVARYSEAIALRLGWKGKQLEDLRQMAILHDVGKIGVPDCILSKAGPLTDEEYMLIKEHTTIGHEILAPLGNVLALDVAALNHHERYDGKGYPNGASGESIPLIARIVTLADVIDAINSDRAYRQGQTTETIIMELERGKGTQFDPVLTEIAIELVQSRTINCDKPVHAATGSVLCSFPENRADAGWGE